MKYLRACLLIAICVFSCHANGAPKGGALKGEDWKFAGDNIRSEWAEKIDVKNVLPEYPRPLMEREEWLNLNGLWDFAILPRDSDMPKKYSEKILVPFPVEAPLSGIGKSVDKEVDLLYSRVIEIPRKWRGKKIMLNFGAVDWRCAVFVNGKEAGEHTGGFVPFSVDITKFLRSGKNEITVRAFDPTNGYLQPRGKQRNPQKGIWYVPASGIWRTVWLEPVDKGYVESVRITPNLDEQSFVFDIETDGADLLEIKVFDGTKVVGKAVSKTGKSIAVKIDNPKLWSPDSPFLYNVEISAAKGARKIDSVKSYAGMRKFSVMKDDDGVPRIALNGKILFQIGTLDQGYWPDGIFTAPSDDALKSDIVRTKEMGFNMIRKHMKLESDRWYMHCDKIGLIVWQDMPCANWIGKPDWQVDKWFAGEEFEPSEEGKKIFYKEWGEIIGAYYSYPCIGIWIPFNERWGQFDTEEVVKFTKERDPSRLIIAASGGNHYKDCGDIVDSHNYPDPKIKMRDPNRVAVCGEFGAVAYTMKGHIYKPFDYGWAGNFKDVPVEKRKELNSDVVLKKYAALMDILIYIAKTDGCSAGVYTQAVDTEAGTNGLITYDRKVVKFDPAKVREINKRVIDCLK